jgi:hypothetical protein
MEQCDCERGVILKKYWVTPILAAILLIVCNWIALAKGIGGEATLYFPLKVNNIWSYKVTLPNNEYYSQIMIVNSQVGQDIRVGVLINRMPFAEVIYSVNEEGLFRAKQISAQGVEVIEPKQMVLAAKIKADQVWNWEAADGREKESVKVIGFEKVTVPVGSFEALLVQYEGVYKNGKAYLDRTWFVKDVGYVKATTTIDGQTIIKELVEYKTN